MTSVSKTRKQVRGEQHTRSQAGYCWLRNGISYEQTWRGMLANTTGPGRAANKPCRSLFGRVPCVMR